MDRITLSMPRPSNRRASHVPGGGVIRALALFVAGSILLAGTPVAWAQTPRTAGKEAAAPVGAAGSWSRYKTSYAAKNEAPNQSWYNLAWDTKRNLAYGIAWDGVLAAFDPVAGRWNNVSDIGETNDFHNRTIGYDPINDFLWVTDGTGGAFRDLRYFDLSARTWHVHSPRGPSYQSTLIFDPEGKRFIAFGGWASESANVRTLALEPIGSGWVSAGVTSGPRFTNDTQKMTAQRSAYDTKRNRIVYVDTDGSLWELSLSPFAWRQLSTTGGPPPPRTQYVYDAANDALVGWVASPNIADGESRPGPRRETWLLPLSTLEWSKGASVGGATAVPPETVYVGYSMVYDPVRRQTILHTLSGTSSFSPETWAYRYPATP